MTRNILKAALAAAALVLPMTEAGAVSLKVKMACSGDYFAHCSQHAPDSPGVRQCMRAVGANLSRGCIDALVAAGEVPKSKVSQRQSTAAAN